MVQTSKWIAIVRELHSLAQAGLTYSKNEYDLERYHRLNELSAEISANQSGLDREAVLQSFSMQAGYATPKIDVRGAVIRDGRILINPGYLLPADRPLKFRQIGRTNYWA